MKMTKQEVKDEYKNTEGDPQIKGRIRGKMREASLKIRFIPETGLNLEKSGCIGFVEIFQPTCTIFPINATFMRKYKEYLIKL